MSGCLVLMKNYGRLFLFFLNTNPEKTEMKMDDEEEGNEV